MSSNACGRPRVARKIAGEQSFERQKWVTNDGIAQVWVNDLISTVMAGPYPAGNATDARNAPSDAFEVSRQALASNRLQGMAFVDYGHLLGGVLGPEFYAHV